MMSCSRDPQITQSTNVAPVFSRVLQLVVVCVILFYNEHDISYDKTNQETVNFITGHMILTV